MLSRTQTHSQSWDFARILCQCQRKAFPKLKACLCAGVCMWGALSGVEGCCLFEGRSKADTQFSQSFPTVVEVGGIYKCMTYVKCLGIAILNILTLSSRRGKLLPPWGSRTASSSPGWPGWLVSLSSSQTGFLSLSPAFSSRGMPTAHGRHGNCWDFCGCYFRFGELYCFQDNWGRIRKGLVQSQPGATEHPVLLAAFSLGKWLMA